jgi:hypothetical protein
LNIFNPFLNKITLIRVGLKLTVKYTSFFFITSPPGLKKNKGAEPFSAFARHSQILSLPPKVFSPYYGFGA